MDAIRLLLLTGARLSEILTGKWSYVDWERGIMFLPDSKTGRKPVYLSAAALVALKDIPRVPGNPYINPRREKAEEAGRAKGCANPSRRSEATVGGSLQAAGLENVRL